MSEVEKVKKQLLYLSLYSAKLTLHQVLQIQRRAILTDSYLKIQQRDHYDVSLLYLQELQSMYIQLSTLVSALVQTALQLSEQVTHRHK
jgi:hypothetical protein